MAQISEELDLLACMAIGWCFEVIEEGGQLFPTLFYPEGDEILTDQSGSMVARTYEDDTPDAGYEAACLAGEALPSSCRCYALAYDGYVWPDQSQDAVNAVIVEFGERGGETAYTACVPYWWDEAEGFLVDEAIPGGEVRLLFS